MNSYGVGTFALGTEAPFPGLVVSGRVTDLRSRFGDHAKVFSLLQEWDRSVAELDAAAASATGIPIEELIVLPPICPAGPFLCAGANYRTHVIEMRTANAIAKGLDGDEAHANATLAMDERAASGFPIVFSGWPGAVIGANDDVIIPGDSGVKHDWEIELAIVIGRFARCVSEAEAMNFVAGYTVLNDISTRDRMHRTDLPNTDFVATKMRPTFKPIGPWITPAKFVSDPQKLRLTLSVNGELMQDDTAGDMIFKIPRLIEYASGMTDLRPGDIIATGSPSGNAAHHGGKFLKPGDVIESEIEGLGAQRNRCVAATLFPHGPDVAPAFSAREAARA